jgi:LSD1 subclass zinc finger protein
VLKFAPGTKSLKCAFCDTTTEILISSETIEEIDFEKFLMTQFENEEKQEIVAVKCNGCNAEVTLKPNVTSDTCPFCGTSLVIKNGTTSSILKPKFLLPFKIKQIDAQKFFRLWIKGLWFAPNNLKKLASGAKQFNGIYIPYWTYDSDTYSDYTGKRGDDYQESETYTTTENGKSVTRTRMVTKTRWHLVSGNLQREFDDVLVMASKSLPNKYAEALEPWDLSELVGFDEKFLSGFRTECYQIDVAQGWGHAKVRMDETIRKDICRRIGGDHQQISTLNTSYQRTTFKHTLLPVWISAYRYKNRPFRFLVNGRTGEVQGERPYSWIKIGFLIILVVMIIFALYGYVNSQT